MKRQKYPFHHLAVGESFIIEWKRESIDEEPKNKGSIVIALWRANNDGTGRRFISQQLWVGMKITRVE